MASVALSWGLETEEGVNSIGLQKPVYVVKDN